MTSNETFVLVYFFLKGDCFVLEVRKRVLYFSKYDKNFCRGSIEIIYKVLIIVQFTFILQISILKMSRILTNEKFRGDNRAVSKIWITQCEGHLSALEIENEKKIRYFIMLFRRDSFLLLA